MGSIPRCEAFDIGGGVGANEIELDVDHWFGLVV